MPVWARSLHFARRQDTGSCGLIGSKHTPFLAQQLNGPRVYSHVELLCNDTLGMLVPFDAAVSVCTHNTLSLLLRGFKDLETSELTIVFHVWQEEFTG